MRRVRMVHAVGAAVFWLAGCAGSPPVIPEPLETQIDKTLTFSQVIESPDSHRGRVIAIGGEVLKAKGLREGTQIEVLELPLDDDYQPSRELTTSRGRFLALQRTFIDPATFPGGTRITIVGEVTGSSVERLDESEYRYPTVEIKHLHVWKARPYGAERSSGPWYGVFGGVGIGGGRSSGGGGISIGTGF